MYTHKTENYSSLKWTTICVPVYIAKETSQITGLNETSQRQNGIRRHKIVLKDDAN